MDIKPGSYPNSINVDNNGVITIAIQRELWHNPNTGAYETILPENVELVLLKDGYKKVLTLSDVPHTYQYVDYLEIDPYLMGSPIYTGPGYILKFRTQDLSSLFAGHVGEENLSLLVRFWDDVHVNPDGSIMIRGNDDSVRLLSNKK